LEKVDSSRSQNLKREFFLHPADATNYLLGNGLGIVYCDFEDSKVRLRKEFETGIIQPFISGSRKGLVISGAKGSGKTTDLHWLAYQFLTRTPADCSRFITRADGSSFPVEVKAPLKIKMVRTSRLVTMLMEKRYEEIESLESVQILMLDDFARHYKHDYPTAKLEEFIETRYANLRPTFITLDITLKELAEEPDWSAMVDRFRDQKWMFPALVIPGTSQRGHDTPAQAEGIGR
jgi:DNA replication protein DnaC